MPNDSEHNQYARLRMLFILSAISIYGIVELVRATSLPDELHSIQEQLIASKRTKSIKYGGASVASETYGPRPTSP
jgi:hypothetical protein